MARQIVVDIVGDSSKFTKATSDASTGATGLTGKLRGIGTGMVVGAGVAAFSVLTTGIGLAISKLDEAKQMYLEDAASQEMLAAAYNRSGVAREIALAAIEAQISANQQLGVSDSAQRDGIAAFIRLTNDATTAQALNTATIDLAAASGMTYEAAQAAIVSGLAGRGTALKKAGIEMEKDMSAMDLAAAISAKYEGAQAKLAQTQGGKLAVANEKVGEAMEKVGSVMAKASSVVLPILADALTFVIDTLGAVGRAITPVTTAVTKALIPVFQAVLPVVRTVFGAVSSIIGALAPAVGTVFGFIGKVIGAAVGLIKGYFGTLGTAINVLNTVFSTITGFVSRVFSSIGGIIRGAINGVIGIINGVISAINNIQVHIHVGPVDLDWNGLNIRHIPRLHSGGVVPGPMGQEVPIMALGGERFIDPHGSGGTSPGGHQFNFYGPIVGLSGMEEVMDLIAARLRLGGATTG